MNSASSGVALCVVCRGLYSSPRSLLSIILGEMSRVLNTQSMDLLCVYHLCSNPAVKRLLCLIDTLVSLDSWLKGT